MYKKCTLCRLYALSLPANLLSAIWPCDDLRFSSSLFLFLSHLASEIRNSSKRNFSKRCKMPRQRLANFSLSRFLSLPIEEFAPRRYLADRAIQLDGYEVRPYRARSGRVLNTVASETSESRLACCRPRERDEIGALSLTGV